MNKFRFAIFIVAFIAFLFSLIINKVFNLYDLTGFDKALEGFLLFASITLGFFGTCISILPSLIKSDIVKDILNIKGYKFDFILITLFTIVTGFVGIVTTITFQILLENKAIPVLVQNLVTRLWVGLSVSYLTYLCLFVIMIMMILFKAGEDKVKFQVVETKVKKSLFKR